VKKLSERMFTGAEDLKLFSGIEQDYLVVLNAFAAEVRKLEAVVEALLDEGIHTRYMDRKKDTYCPVCIALDNLEDTDG